LRGGEVYKVDTVNFAILQEFHFCFRALCAETEVDTMRGVHLPEWVFGLTCAAPTMRKSRSELTTFAPSRKARRTSGFGNARKGGEWREVGGNRNGGF